MAYGEHCLQLCSTPSPIYAAARRHLLNKCVKELENSIACFHIQKNVGFLYVGRTNENFLKAHFRTAPRQVRPGKPMTGKKSVGQKISRTKIVPRKTKFYWAKAKRTNRKPTKCVHENTLNAI